ncbi:imelysin family protein [Rhodovulum marinum]|uniref:Putative iron-regulated protein n=1 Tax=Rhodovulum marinum TaxID=320662 RepID=A0A4R2PXK2_9RHOB|nr:imelysin family protein [Rhodovulum marinum]TCP39878.1 putative iron-regulated protein [Rhodovulum marinum]
MTSFTLSLRISLIAGSLAAAGAAQAQSAREVIDGYADLALAKYSDSLAAAKALDAAIDAFIAAPSAETHKAGKDAWLAARVPYQQTEVYRFGNAVVDDWEGKVNAWPLDEGLIDYVDTGYYGEMSEENGFFRANVIANPDLTVGGQSVDAREITPALLQELHEIDGIEANVATGYHAIEFLLWGQDTNGTGPGAGSRSYTDFVQGDGCTNAPCDRRADYLAAVSDLLVADLKDIVTAWEDGGAARTDLAAQSDAEGLATILTGMGSLSYGELAGERMKLGLILHDPEEEHDCFADNTHNSHYYDAKGIQNVYLGRYERPDGTVMEVPSLAGLAQSVNSEVDAVVTARLEATMAAMGAMKDRADSGVEAYDQMIGYGNDTGNAIVQAAIDALVDQTRAFEDLVAALDASEISVEGSDSLDNPGAVFE